jgi:hypothetical protein
MSKRIPEPASALTDLERLSDDLAACLLDFRTEKKSGQVDLHFSEGELASVEIEESYSPENRVGAFSPENCMRFAARKVHSFIQEKKSGRVSLLYDSGEIASVKSFLRLRPGRKHQVLDKKIESS